MTRRKFGYEVRGTPEPLPSSGFLILNKDTGKTVPAPQMKESKDRSIRLRIYHRGGDGSEILQNLRYGGGPSGDSIELIITRDRYFAIISRIAKDLDLVRSIVSDWRREAVHYLNGATQPISRGRPSYKFLLAACEPSDPQAASIILSVLGDTITSQIVDEYATEDDLGGISPLFREFIDTQESTNG